MKWVIECNNNKDNNKLDESWPCKLRLHQQPPSHAMADDQTIRAVCAIFLHWICLSCHWLFLTQPLNLPTPFAPSGCVQPGSYKEPGTHPVEGAHLPLWCKHPAGSILCLLSALTPSLKSTPLFPRSDVNKINDSFEIDITRDTNQMCRNESKQTGSNCVYVESHRCRTNRRDVFRNRFRFHFTVDFFQIKTRNFEHFCCNRWMEIVWRNIWLGWF